MRPGLRCRLGTINVGTFALGTNDSVVGFGHLDGDLPGEFDKSTVNDATLGGDLKVMPMVPLTSKQLHNTLSGTYSGH